MNAPRRTAEGPRLPHADLAPAARRARRLGVLGGSFDPPHAGHAHAARAAAERFGLDHVLLVPAARPPHKPDRRLAPAEDRLAMLERFAAGEPAWSLWSAELAREGPSYTVDTLRELRRLAPEAELFLVIGSDNLAGLPAWREAEEVLSLARPVVVARSGEEWDETALERLSPPARARVTEGRVDAPGVEASATEIRARLARDGDPGPAVAEAVAEYARGRGVYRRMDERGDERADQPEHGPEEEGR